jgi:hypothetical protein
VTGTPSTVRVTGEASTQTWLGARHVAPPAVTVLSCAWHALLSMVEPW